MQYKILGKGGQGVLFLSKVLSEALLLQGVVDFSFLKEFDEGQRSGEIRVTFTLPFDLPNKELVIKENNILELKKISKELGLENINIEKALEKVKPQAFQKNLKVWQAK